METIEQQLPELPSELIRVALADLEACEANESYVIDMANWHVPGDSRLPCHVCLAGSVIAQTLDTAPTCDKLPGDYGDEGISNALYALDDLRMGHIAAAFDVLNRPLRGLPQNVNVTDYQCSPEQFKADMRDMIELLEQHGQ